MLSSCIIRLHDRNHRRPGRVRILFMITYVVLVALACKLYKRNQIRFKNRKTFQTHFELEMWRNDQLRACDGNLVGYGHQFVRLKNAKYIPDKHSFIVPCRGSVPRYWFYHGHEGTPYNSWIGNIEISDYENEVKNDAAILKSAEVTFAVYRMDSHNLYHTMCEWYNIFLLTKLFDFDMSTIAILLMDSRPQTAMDPVWTTLFGRVFHHHLISSNMVFKDLFWIPIGYESPLNFHYLEKTPHIEEFHRLFVGSFGVDAAKTLNCSRLTYTVILRHDYLSHPERLTEYKGMIHRKFKNEYEVLSQVKEVVGQHNVRGVVLEELEMKEQVELMSKTDVLIGIHGAGMTHIVSLPHHATVLELRPYSMDKEGLNLFHHFRALARYRGLRYLTWTSNNANDSVFSFDMHVPIPVISDYVQNIRDVMCPIG